LRYNHRQIEDLEARADELCLAIAQVLINLGYEHGKFEVWPRFIPGSWCLVVNDKVVDKVLHKID